MVGSRGVANIKCRESIMQLENLTDMVWNKNLFQIAHIIDIGLFSEEGRQNYSDIGSSIINQEVLDFVLANSYWINVCSFVNDDFRSAIIDAITIEQALCDVDPSDYSDLRDDMKVPTIWQKRSQSTFKTNLDIPLSEVDDDRFRREIMESKSDIKNHRLNDAYMELERTITGDALNDVVMINNNLVYVINAFDKNDVFFKYVKLVVDNVRNILSNK